MKSGMSNNKSALGGVVVAVVIVAAVLAAGYFLLMGNKGGASSINDSGDHQAVFLTNGQVYFGIVDSRSDEYIVLSDIYYLRVQTALQQSGQVDAAGQPIVEQQTNTSLVKLGDELHGPEDEMVINADHVIFTEELKSDSALVEAIAEHKAQPVEEAATE